jgi:hypothetical protein
VIVSEESDVKKYILSSLAVLALSSATALAQSSYQSTTTTTAVTPAAPAPVAPPPPGVLSRTTVTKSNDGMGDKTYSRKTTYGDGQAAVSQSTRTQVTAPPPVAIESSKRTTTTTTSSGN